MFSFSSSGNCRSISVWKSLSYTINKQCIILHTNYPVDLFKQHSVAELKPVGYLEGHCKMYKDTTVESKSGRGLSLWPLQQSNKTTKGSECMDSYQQHTSTHVQFLGWMVCKTLWWNNALYKYPAKRILNRYLISTVIWEGLVNTAEPLMWAERFNMRQSKT